MSNSDRHTGPDQRKRDLRDAGSAVQSAVEQGRERYNWESGQWGAHEPDYGRPYGEHPEHQPVCGPNRHGPQYEEGGRYPGTRENDEEISLSGRREDSG